MAGITLAQAETKLATWIAAEEKVASGQEARQGDRVLKYADLEFIGKRIDYWDAKVKQLSEGDGSGNITPKAILPIDR